ncbi:MAG: YciI family protein, partial [Steroidobacteraceae bacterium]
MKFLCIAHEEEQKLDRLSKAEWQALRQQTLDYVETLLKQGRLIVTQALRSATTASIVRVRDGKLSITDG